MASKRVPVTITYRNPDTSPPVFLSGTFSDPAWQPQEMTCVVDDDGNRKFQLEISASEGSKVEYKFRLGPGDWWVLDETAETVHDGLGNTNNVLTVPDSSCFGNVDDNLEDFAEDDTADPPMLSHETYKPDDIKEWPLDAPTTDQEVFGCVLKDEEIDSNDPRLERFPCENRSSIFAALRKIEGSVSEDGTSIEIALAASNGLPPSPQIPSTSPDLSTSPKSHATDLPRSSRSLASLQSIEETLEEEPIDVVQDRIHNNSVSPGSGNTQTVQGPVVTPLPANDSVSSEDEGISMSSNRKENDTDTSRHRNKAIAPPISRSLTPSTVHPMHEASSDKNWYEKS